MKKDEHIIVIGDKVDLQGERGPSYRTMVEDILDGGRQLMVSIPIYRGIPVPLRQGQEMSLCFYREGGRYLVLVQVGELFEEGNIRLFQLYVRSEVQKQQRRDSFRVAIKLTAVIRPYADGPFLLDPEPEEMETEETVAVENLSETGVRLKAGQRYEKGERIYLHLFLGAADGPKVRPVELLGEVRQVEADALRHEFHLGVMFLELSDGTRRQISRFLMQEQQQRLRQQKLVEGE